MNIKTLSVKDLSNITGISTHMIYRMVKDNDLPIIQKGNRRELTPTAVREILLLRGLCKIDRFAGAHKIVILGAKGGIGKTTIATNIAEGLSRLGFSVLFGDLDSQGNGTAGFGKKKQGQPVLINIINGTSKIEDTIVNVHENLDILPSSLANLQLDHFLSNHNFNPGKFFSNIFKPVEDKYDFIVLDCPPALNKITFYAAFFANTNIIPLNADADSLDGVVMTVSELIKIEKEFSNSGSKVNYNIIFNKYDAREKLSLTIMGEVAQNPLLKDNLMPVVIRVNTAFKNTKADGEHIYDIKKSTAKEDLLSLVAELSGISNALSKEVSQEDELVSAWIGDNYAFKGYVKTTKS